MARCWSGCMLGYLRSSQRRSVNCVGQAQRNDLKSCHMDNTTPYEDSAASRPPREFLHCRRKSV